MNNSSQFFQRLFNWQFGVAAALLVVGFISLNSIESGWAWLLTKKEIPLEKPLTSIPHELGPYKLVNDEKLPDKMVRSLGTENYLSWVLRDTRKAAGSPGAAIRLHVAYYTGNQEPVSAAHVPEICYVAGGYKAVDIRQNSLIAEDGKNTGGTDDAETTPATASGLEIPVREFVYMLPGLPETGSVLYFFIYNGRYVASRSEVTLSFMDRRTQYVYYCKVEVNPGSFASTPNGTQQFRPGTYTSEETHMLVSEFLVKFLPHLNECLPDSDKQIDHPEMTSGKES